MYAGMKAEETLVIFAWDISQCLNLGLQKLKPSALTNFFFF